ncbi:uncharacterized protein RAG0_09634 [Rhynchosporium agropyri]|uniref:Uncharacterized protein n=1 Tax=Rhynchosporium agropyri TaxID=914238 RepID=A0A1E1KWB1_9HELO|nr:uncharacterized protein RAG0_09634 [Rhynchosporium agropyri]
MSTISSCASSSSVLVMKCLLPIDVVASFGMTKLPSTQAGKICLGAGLVIIGETFHFDSIETMKGYPSVFTSRWFVLGSLNFELFIYRRLWVQREYKRETRGIRAK